MHRRSFLVGCVSTLPLSVAGCLESLSAEETPRYPDARDVDADTPTHDLYVENYDAVSHVVTLSVTRAGDGALVWRRTYEAPDGRAFYVPDLLVTGRTYDVELAIRSGAEATERVPIEPCPHAGDSRNVGVRIRDGSITYRQDNCDEITVGADLAAGDHEQFALAAERGGFGD